MGAVSPWLLSGIAVFLALIAVLVLLFLRWHAGHKRSAEAFEREQMMRRDRKNRELLDRRLRRARARGHNGETPPAGDEFDPLEVRFGIEVPTEFRPPGTRPFNGGQAQRSAEAQAR